jgi:cell division inhibitor SepF
VNPTSQRFGNFARPADPYGYENDPYSYDDMDGQGYQPYYTDDHSPYEQSPRSYEPNSHRYTSSQTNSDGVSGKVVNLTGARHRVTEVLVIEPQAFEDIPYVIQALREYKSVVLNLSGMDPDYIQRTIDFIAGGTHAIDGNHERIGEGIFLFTPSCVQVRNQPSAAPPSPPPVWP